MFVLFEEAGKYLGGRVISEAEASAQVELDTGKRVKAKSAHIVLHDQDRPGRRWPGACLDVHGAEA